MCSKKRAFLVAAKPLGALFKGKFKAELSALKLLKETPKKGWVKNWVVDCQNVGNGMSSFKYLGAYMQRVFISNDRIEKYDGEDVVFRYKESKSGQTIRKTMHALQFILMLLQHVLPSGFQKTRYYELLGNANKKTLRKLQIMILTGRNQPPQDTEASILLPTSKKRQNLTLGKTLER